MNQNRFADKLKMLMKERKVSGQKIASELNVTQKTISRYATGEIVPSEEMQQRILQAIANLGGHPEDAEVKKIKILPMTIREVLESGLPLMSDEELEEQEMREWESDKHKACQIFSMLEKKNQKFVMEHFQMYCDLDAYEIAIVEAFSVIPEDKREFVLDELNVIRIDYTAMLNNPYQCKKAAQYMEMISKCKDLVPEQYEKYQELPNDIEETEELKAYEDMLEKTSGINVEKMGTYLPELINFDEKDWYLLMLVQLVSMHDKGANVTYWGRFVGDKIHLLINYLEKLADESKEAGL